MKQTDLRLNVTIRRARKGEFLGQLDFHVRRPDESTILRLRHRLEKHKPAGQMLATVNAWPTGDGLLLKVGTAVDAMLIPALSSAKNTDKIRHPETHSSKKGNQYHFGVKAHVGVGDDSGLVHIVHSVSDHVGDTNNGNSLLRMAKKPMPSGTLATRE